MKDLSSYIQTYYKGWNWISDLESYKWGAFKHFKENYAKDFDTINDWARNIFGKADNLLTSFRYLPFDVLLDFSKPNGKPHELKTLFNDLWRKDTPPTKERVCSFIEGAKTIMQTMAEEGYSDWKERKNLNTYQDAHAVSVYLSMFYPNDFYIYKYSIFKDFAQIVDFPIKSSDAIERLFEYQELCNLVKEELKKDADLIKHYKNWLRKNNYEDQNLNLLTQDFIYAVVVYLNSDSYRKIKGNKERVSKLIEITAADIVFTPSQKQHAYKGVKGVDYQKISRQNEDLGVAGELWVVNSERERLISLNIDPNNVKHAAKEIGDGCGYDILSVENDGKTPRYIEVKTTSGSSSQPIFFSDNEMRFSVDNKDHYYLYRVSNFKSADAPAVLTIVKASLDELNAEPVSYRAKILHK